MGEIEITVMRCHSDILSYIYIYFFFLIYLMNPLRKGCDQGKIGWTLLKFHELNYISQILVIKTNKNTHTQKKEPTLILKPNNTHQSLHGNNQNIYTQTENN